MKGIWDDRIYEEVIKYRRGGEAPNVLRRVSRPNRSGIRVWGRMHIGVRICRQSRPMEKGRLV